MSAPEKHSKPARTLILGFVAILATAAGIWSATIILDQRDNLKELEATRFPVPRSLAPFDLIDHNNQPFNEPSLHNSWSFLFFGYTHCPDVCPTTLSVLNSVAHKLQDLETDIRFIFVTVDPARDTPEKLASFVSYFNDDFIGVTGTEENMGLFTRELGIMHMRLAPAENSLTYIVDHTAAVLLIDPDGRYHAVFTPPLEAENIAHDFRAIFKAY